MSRKHLWNETVDKVKMRLSKWKMNTLSIGGRLTLIKSSFFNGHDIKSKKASWVNWKKAIVAKDRGGLGISSLYAMNRGLLLKWVWRFVTQKNTLWARVIQALHGVDGRIGTSLKGGQRSCWTSIIQEVNNLGQKGIDFMSLISIKLGNGEKTRFWEDKWCADGILKTKYPRLYALESCKLISVGTKLSHSSICSSFRRNLEVLVMRLDQLVRLEDDLKGVVLSSNDDRWVWELESTGDFSVSSIRVETTSHLFFSCSVARDVVKLITRWWCIDDVELESFDDWEIWFDNVRLPQNNKKMLEGVFFVTWWYLWLFRNKILFNSKSPVKALLFDEVSKWSIEKRNENDRNFHVVGSAKGLSRCYKNSMLLDIPETYLTYRYHRWSNMVRPDLEDPPHVPLGDGQTMLVRLSELHVYGMPRLEGCVGTSPLLEGCVGTSQFVVSGGGRGDIVFLHMWKGDGCSFFAWRLTPSTFPQRHFAGDMFPQRHVAGEKVSEVEDEITLVERLVRKRNHQGSEDVKK
ncbi:hypothetical protein Tco_0565142 [Tanacetum coccineum]